MCTHVLRHSTLLIVFASCVLIVSNNAYAKQQTNQAIPEFVITPKESADRDEVAKLAHESIQKITDLLGPINPDPIRIHLASSQGEFDSLIGQRFPDWGAAAAIPHRREVILKSPLHFKLSKSLPELVTHELSHIALSDKAGTSSAPRWLDEGVAMYLSAEWSWTDNLALSQASVFGSFLRLRDIDDVNQFSEGKAQVAYATSRQAVDYLITNYTPQALRNLLSHLAMGSSVDSALMAAIGANETQFDEEFTVYLAGKFNFGSLLSDTMYFWIALAFLLILGGYLSLRRRREYYRKWEAEDKLHSRDFDYGDPSSKEIPDDEEPWRE